MYVYNWYFLCDVFFNNGKLLLGYCNKNILCIVIKKLRRSTTESNNFIFNYETYNKWDLLIMHNSRKIAHSKWSDSLTVLTLIFLKCIVKGSGFATQVALWWLCFNEDEFRDTTAARNIKIKQMMGKKIGWWATNCSNIDHTGVLCIKEGQLTSPSLSWIVVHLPHSWWRASVL